MTAVRSVLPSASPWFVAACMVLISVSLAGLLYLQAGLTIAEAGWLGFGALLLMVLAEFFSARARERSAVEAELQEMARLALSLEREVIRLRERVGAFEADVQQRVEEAVDVRLTGLSADVVVLESLVRDLGDTVAALERPAPPVRAPVQEAAPQSATAMAARVAAGPPLVAPDGPFAGMSETDAMALVRKAVDQDGVEVFLQPIVTLPQRRIAFYEALGRLRLETGGLADGADFVPLARQAGVMPVVDNIMLFRCVRIIRRMALKSKDVGIFCNISAQTLADAEFFQQFVDFIGDNRGLAESVIFELSQAEFDGLGPIEQANLEALVDLGFRLSVDNVRRLDLDCARLADRKVSFVKVDADLLINPPPASGANIHAADLARLLQRYGIQLIVTRVESEAQVVDLLDYDAAYGQGRLFSPPRPIRSDVIRADAPEQARPAREPREAAIRSAQTGTAALAVRRDATVRPAPRPAPIE